MPDQTLMVGFLNSLSKDFTQCKRLIIEEREESLEILSKKEYEATNYTMLLEKVHKESFFPFLEGKEVKGESKDSIIEFVSEQFEIEFGMVCNHTLFEIQGQYYIEFYLWRHHYGILPYEKLLIEYSKLKIDIQKKELIGYIERLSSAKKVKLSIRELIYYEQFFQELDAKGDKGKTFVLSCIKTMLDELINYMIEYYPIEYQEVSDQIDNQVPQTKIKKFSEEKIIWKGTAKQFVQWISPNITGEIISYQNSRSFEKLAEALCDRFYIPAKMVGKSKGGEISVPTLITYLKKEHSGDPY